MQSVTSTTAPSGQQFELRSGPFASTIVEVGGGLRSFTVDGRDILDGYPVDEIAPAGAGQVLAPWPNRIRDGHYHFNGEEHQLALSEAPLHNAIHGLVRWLPWHATATSADSVTVECTLPAQGGYPWTLRLSTTWSLGADGLTASHRATNLSASPAPFGLGVHPYFVLPGTPIEQVVIGVPGRNRLLVDGRLLPIGAAKVAGGEYDFTTPRRLGDQDLDTAFGDLPGGASTVTLSTVDGASRIEVWADEQFHWWQLFTSQTLPPPRFRRAIAVEPMTCPPDAFHSGRDLVTLQPGDTWSGTWGVRPRLAA
ncbi:MAG TPA: aldose 1-epimerase family protein [Rugosimonospora sp.]|nr:aldose 1-epimerase family protein [Rugosimonospora sp.]